MYLLIKSVISFFPLILLTNTSCDSPAATAAVPADTTRSAAPAQEIVPGAHRTAQYLPLLKGKNVALFANHTSMVKDRHLADVLKENGIAVKKVFAPEHGFRGKADAGEKVSNSIDEETGIPVVSLYGSKRKPSAADMRDVDVVIFDIQDVGVRFYTYISSLQDMMEACVEFNKPLLVMDRPNPNGFYVDGPVLDMQYKSFVGMQPIPVVYGMTMGEYAAMLLKENMLTVPAPGAVLQIDGGTLANKFSLTIIKNDHYTHRSKYVLPVKPSPNLPDIETIYLYPSTCFFEGTVLSEGRGTDKPFRVFGHPSLPSHLYSFTPNPTDGAKNSKHYGKTCYGWMIDGTAEDVLKEVNNQLQLKYLIEAYRLFPDKSKFFVLPKSGKMEASFFNKLAGNNELWQQLKNGVSEADIRKSWEPGLSAFKQMRKKHLLYEDFE